MKQKSLLRIVVAGALAMGTVAAPVIARANCLTDNIDDLPSLASRRFTMTIVSDNGGWVSYLPGLLFRDTATSGEGIGPFGQFFSDRFNGNQHFAANATDTMSFTAH